VVRYTANGTLDITFRGNGVSLFGFGGIGAAVTSVALQSDGKIVVGGREADPDTLRSAIARLNTNGSLDTTFDGDGKVTSDILPGAEQILKIQIESGGRIVAAVQGSANTPGQADFGVARYNANGSLDTSFGVGGIVNTDLSGSDFTRAAVISGDK